MNRKSVTSSNIKSIGYDENTKTLEIDFKRGGLYQYSDVPMNVYIALINATSHGKYFQKFVRDKYATTKVI